MELSNSEILQKAIADGIIDINTLGKQIEMNERKKYLDMHKYNIWQGEKDHKWYTYLPDHEKGRRLVKRTSQRDIEEVVISYLKEEEANPTVGDIYKEWIQSKLERGEIQKSTRDRYNRQYKESLSEFGKRKIKYIEEYDIEDFMLKAIYEHSLTQKGFSNLRTIIYGIFKRAKKRKLVSFSITEVISDMEISKKSFRKNVKSDKELVFTDKEIQTISDYIAGFDTDIVNLGILLCFKSGVRPGELSALKWCDIQGRILKVNRTEISYENDNGHIITEVRDFPKTEAGIRDVIIPKSGEWILKKIRSMNPFGEFVFERNGERVKNYMFTRRLKRICKKNNILPKSLNKVRKTYGTILLDSGVSESIVTSQMGHTDIRTTKMYYYKDRNDMEKKMDVIDHVSNL